MLHANVGLLNIHGRVRVCRGICIQNQSVAAHGYASAVRARDHSDKPAIIRHSATEGNGLGNNARAGVRRDVHDLSASILNLARQRNIDWGEGNVALLSDPNELNLIRTMLRLPEVVEQVARTLEPHHLPHYALDLATAFHWFYENCRVLSARPEDDQVTLARLKLVESAQIVFRRSLELMGMGAPERM